MADNSKSLDEKTLASAAGLDLFDVKGNKITFGSLYEKEKTIVVFIRHFLCGICQDYVSQLTTVSKDALSAAGTRIVVIGCGEWTIIESYAEITGFTGPIYADPTRNLHRTFGMIETLARTPAGQERRSYMKSGPFSNMLQSIWRGILHINFVGKQGNLSQLGGDLVLGPGNHCSFSHLMRNTEDHVEVADLMNAAGVVYP